MPEIAKGGYVIRADTVRSVANDTAVFRDFPVMLYANQEEWRCP